MKGKKLIVIMAIVILMFTIQASCALENDNDFNLTQTTDVNTVNNQIVDDNVISNQVNDVKDELNDSADIKNSISVSSKSSVLGASNENNVLGNSSNTKPMTDFINLVSNAGGKTIFLNGSTYGGSFSSSISIPKDVTIYGGYNTTDGIKATLDLSGYQIPSTQSGDIPRIKFSSNSIINGVNFVNHYFYSNDTKGKNLPGRGHVISASGAVSFYNCTFANNTVYMKCYIINYNGNSNGVTIENCVFSNNTASVIVAVPSGSTNFIAKNNLFENNKGTCNNINDSNSNSLGLCMKVSCDGAVIDNNTFINNTNATHGAALCVNAENEHYTDWIEPNDCC